MSAQFHVCGCLKKRSQRRRRIPIHHRDTEFTKIYHFKLCYRRPQRAGISELLFTTDKMAAEGLVKIICLLVRTASTTSPVKSNTIGRKDRAPSPFHNQC